MELLLPYETFHVTRHLNRVELEGSFGKIGICSEPGITSAITTIQMTVGRGVIVQLQFPVAEVCLRYWQKGDWDGRQGAYQLVYQPAGNWVMEMAPGDYQLTSAAIGADLLGRLSPHYSSIRDMLQFTANKHVSVQRQYASRIDARVKGLLHHVGQCELKEVNRELFMEVRTNDLMLQYLNYISSYQMNFQTKYHFSPDDLAGIYEAKDTHDQTIDQPTSIKDLAKTVNLHPRKLGAGLGLLFGKSIRQLRVQARMEKAAQLLQDPAKTIRDVAIETGFESFCAFSRAFRQHFGCTPLEFRK